MRALILSFCLLSTPALADPDPTYRSAFDLRDANEAKAQAIASNAKWLPIKFHLTMTGQAVAGRPERAPENSEKAKALPDQEVGFSVDRIYNRLLQMGWTRSEAIAVRTFLLHQHFNCSSVSI